MIKCQSDCVLNDNMTSSSASAENTLAPNGRGDLTSEETRNACLTVYHDGSCPLCQREIALAQSLTHGHAIAFVDVSGLPDMGHVAPDLSASDAMRRFHVRRADGTLLHGAAAFIEMWSTSAKLKWLAPLGSSRRVVAVLDFLYGGFLRLRPALSAALKRYDRWKAAKSTNR